MRILVTGSTGFIGSRLLKAFVEKGHEVVAVKRSTSNLWRIEPLLNRIQTIDADKNSPAEILEKHPVDTIVHTVTTYGRDGRLSECIETNVLWPMRLLEALKPGSTFVNTDSCFTKDRSYSYLQGYTATKAHLVELAKTMLEKSSIAFVNMKLEHPYGTQDTPWKFMTSIIRQCLQDVPKLDLTEGMQAKDFVYLKDVVGAYLKVFESGLPTPGQFKEFEVGTGEPNTIRTVVSRIHALSGSRTELRFGALPYRKNEIMRSQADMSALRAIGFQNQWSLDAGLSEVIESEREALKAEAK